MAYIGKYPVRMPQVGDYYQGGIIFHISGEDETGLHGLIAATTDQSTGTAWSNVDSTLVGGTAKEIGTGMANTLKIIAQPGHTASAAQLCRDYRGGGFTDWYLPSIYERMFLQFYYASFGLPVANYWTSSENNATYGYYMFPESTVAIRSYSGLKSSAQRVRAIRSF